MEYVNIDKISINDNGILNLTINEYSFALIYRSAMGVHWNEQKSYLYHNPSAEWDTMRWYNQIISAAKTEYGIILKTNNKTRFEKIDNKIFLEMRKITG